MARVVLGVPRVVAAHDLAEVAAGDEVGRAIGDLGRRLQAMAPHAGRFVEVLGGVEEADVVGAADVLVPEERERAAGRRGARGRGRSRGPDRSSATPSPSRRARSWPAEAAPPRSAPAPRSAAGACARVAAAIARPASTATTREVARGEQARRLTGAAADLDHARAGRELRERDHVVDERRRVARAHRLVVGGGLIEDGHAREDSARRVHEGERGHGADEQRRADADLVQPVADGDATQERSDGQREDRVGRVKARRAARTAPAVAHATSRSRRPTKATPAAQLHSRSERFAWSMQLTAASMTDEEPARRARIADPDA